MGLGGTTRGHDAFANPGNDGLFAGTTDQTIDIGAHCHPRRRLHLNTIFGDGSDQGRVDDLRIHRHLDRFQHITTRQIDRRSPFEGQFDIGLVCRDQSKDDGLNIATGQIVCFHALQRHVDAGLVSADLGSHDRTGGHLAQPHSYQVAENADFDTGEVGCDPQSDRYEVREQTQENDEGEKNRQIK